MRGKPVSGFRLTRKRLEVGAVSPDLLLKYQELQRAAAIVAKFDIKPDPTKDYTAVIRQAIAEDAAKRSRRVARRKTSAPRQRKHAEVANVAPAQASA